MRLRQNAQGNCFALWDMYLGMYSRTFRALPALPRLCFPPREMWTHSQPSLAVLRGTFKIIVWDSVHSFYRLFYNIWTLPYILGTAGHVPAELSAGEGQNQFWLTPIAPSLCRSVWIP